MSSEATQFALEYLTDFPGATYMMLSQAGALRGLTIESHVYARIRKTVQTRAATQPEVKKSVVQQIGLADLSSRSGGQLVARVEELPVEHARLTAALPSIERVLREVVPLASGGPKRRTQLVGNQQESEPKTASTAVDG